MPAGAFSSKKMGSATQECPNAKGIICVIATRADTVAPIADAAVVVNGPTPGTGTTDATGISQFDGRTPGPYACDVTFPAPKYKDWALLPYSKELSVSGGSVSILEVQASPTGTLVVEIREEGGALIQGAAEVQASGPGAVSERMEGGTRTFPRIACGTYEVTARLPAKYQSQTLTAAPVSVPEGGSALAKIVVPSITWIEVKLVTEDGAAVPNEDYVITTRDGRQVRGKTDEKGVGRAEGIVPGPCKIAFPNLDKDAWEGA
jgi:hypothetical protein